MEIINILNSKGGVGKTTTAITLATLLAKKGVATLLVDMAPQGNASASLAASIDEYNVTTFIEKGSELTQEEAIRCIKSLREEKYFEDIAENLNVLTSSPRMNNFKKKLYKMDDDVVAYQLRDALKVVEDWFDVVIIDNDPMLDVFATISLAASTCVICPVKMDLYSFDGSKALVSFMSEIKSTYNPDLAIKGFLPTLYKERKMDQEVIEQFKIQYDSSLVMQSRIRNRSVVDTAVSTRIPIPYIEPNNDIVLDYMKTLYEIKVLDTDKQNALAAEIIDLDFKINSKKESEKAKRKGRKKKD
ncbi:MAG: ParA family protein [Eubacteriales bacterium]|nr:ParA family protein [Eubacteriales bacterium]